MLINKQLNRNKIFLLALLASLVTITLQLYLFDLELFSSLSSLFLRYPPYISLFNEFAPLGITLLALVWMKMGRLTKREGRPMTVLPATLILLGSVLIALILFRGWDIIAMVSHPYNVDLSISIESRVQAEIWMRIFFFSTLSVVLLVFFTVHYGRNGLKTLFLPAMIPAFYTFNTDIIVYANIIPSFSIFSPIYNFIIEFGRILTLALGGIFSTFGIQNSVYVNRFPYSVIMGGVVYIINLPCIGWEGVVGYTLIFLIFISDLEIGNKMKIFWAITGFLGTLFVNLLRITLIFSAGLIWGASVADLIHQNAGDIIFLVWILVFWYIVLRFSNRIEHAFKVLRSSLKGSKIMSFLI